MVAVQVTVIDAKDGGSIDFDWTGSYEESASCKAAVVDAALAKAARHRNGDLVVTFVEGYFTRPTNGQATFFSQSALASLGFSPSREGREISINELSKLTVKELRICYGLFLRVHVLPQGNPKNATPSRRIFMSSAEQRATKEKRAYRRVLAHLAKKHDIPPPANGLFLPHDFEAPRAAFLSWLPWAQRSGVETWTNPRPPKVKHQKRISSACPCTCEVCVDIERQLRPPRTARKSARAQAFGRDYLRRNFGLWGMQASRKLAPRDHPATRRAFPRAGLQPEEESDDPSLARANLANKLAASKWPRRRSGRSRAPRLRAGAPSPPPSRQRPPSPSRRSTIPEPPRAMPRALPAPQTTSRKGPKGSRLGQRLLRAQEQVKNHMGLRKPETSRERRVRYARVRALSLSPARS